MRKVIKGKLYDTDKATMVASYDNDLPINDFRYEGETLYRKRTGEYFVHCEGGALSAYAQSSGDATGWGELVRPVTYDEAKAWMESHADADAYEREFGVPDEDAEHDLHVIVSEAAWQSISRAATVRGVTVRAIIEECAANLR